MLRILASRIVRQRGITSKRLIRHTNLVPSKLSQIQERAFTKGLPCHGRPRQYEDHSRYPRPRSTRPHRPEHIANEALMDQINGIPEDNGADILEKIKITDEEISKIYDSVMDADRRRERDEQSLRHRSREQHLQMRRSAREKLRGESDIDDASSASEKSKSDADSKKTKDERSSNLESGLITEKTMEDMVFVDTRTIREMEEGRLELIASSENLQVERLKERIKDARNIGNSSEASDKGLEVSELDKKASDLLADLSPKLTLAEFNHVIFANMVAGRIDEAVAAYNLIEEAGLKPDQTTFANLTLAHAKAGDLPAAISMFKQLEDYGLEPTLYSYGTLIKAYAEFDRVDDAFRVYEAMKAREVWPNLPVYNNLIVACLKIGDYKRAWGVFEHLRYTIAKPDEISFSIMIHTCAKNGEVEKAMNLFEEMISNNLTLSDVTFNSLIHACAMRPDYFDEGFRMLQLMEAQGFQPDFYTYNTLIYACARKKNLGLARSLFKDMLERSMDPSKQGLLKIDPVTITNMMWAYSGYLYNTKTCSWKMAQKHETLAMDVLHAIKAQEENSAEKAHESLAKTFSGSSILKPSHSASFAKLIEAQERAARATREIIDGKSKKLPKEIRDKQNLDLINVLMPEKVPELHNSVGSEARRVMRFYVDALGGQVNVQLLNAYISAMICNGRYRDAWHAILHDFKKHDIPKDGWTFQRMIRLCARTRDVPTAWRAWDEFKAWRADVETALKTPGHEKLKRSRTAVYKTTSPDLAAGNSSLTNVSGQNGDEEAMNRSSREMLALAEGMEFPGENALPGVIAGGGLAVLPSDREIARRKIGCDMKTEHATYIEMITLLGSCGDFRSAVNLIREEKTSILEHQHRPTMEDVNSLYQNAVVAGDKHSALDIRNLCMQKPIHSARRALHRKWGTSFSWDLTDPQRKSLSRRFPEEFRPRKAPFKDGEQVSLSRK
ncbi:hypothetical protein J3B02_001098 [Coemansia erecta]|uniref:PROP1-like PPR domain-containing protein n=1 Tax=Coemansia asiatica TaxID=1052880 RepID=A0A9W7XS39_9FUNG|nr:hypothetical protein LPJ64_000359 [Coemansia asiatica]KAJ2857289.1 hypothetical protein J3B02_001098 [Coemansia erecta]